jgi:hypothetical protein
LRLEAEKLRKKVILYVAEETAEGDGEVEREGMKGRATATLSLAAAKSLQFLPHSVSPRPSLSSSTSAAASSTSEVTTITSSVPAPSSLPSSTTTPSSTSAATSSVSLPIPSSSSSSSATAAPSSTSPPYSSSFHPNLVSDSSAVLSLGTQQLLGHPKLKNKNERIKLFEAELKFVESLMKIGMEIMKMDPLTRLDPVKKMLSDLNLSTCSQNDTTGVAPSSTSSSSSPSSLPFITFFFANLTHSFSFSFLFFLSRWISGRICHRICIWRFSSSLRKRSLPSNVWSVRAESTQNRELSRR